MEKNKLWLVENNDNYDSVNCQLPQSFLENNSDFPILIDISSSINKDIHTICMVDDFFDNSMNIIRISPIVHEFLNNCESVHINIIGDKSTIQKVKTITFEPQSDLFYSLPNPKLTLEQLLQKSYIIGNNYIFPIIFSNNTFNVKIVKLQNQDDINIDFGNINNVDINVEFVPLPQITTKINDQSNLIIKKIHNETKTGYDCTKKWIPFCGLGHILSSGKKVTGEQQF